MVNIMENPMNKWMIWEVKSPYFWFNTHVIPFFYRPVESMIFRKLPVFSVERYGFCQPVFLEGTDFWHGVFFNIGGLEAKSCGLELTQSMAKLY